jgi:2-polyprenyl-6-methoxyphenol hydroxylase-like FAD-dependent oxidoreductase
MSTIIVLGAGVIGLSTAMLLSKQGHNVTVLERDATPTPASSEAAWTAWERRGVAQFRQPHYLHSAARELLDTHLPEVTRALLRNGCIRFDLTSLMPRTITDRAPRAGDERFVTVTGRRPTLEHAVASAADERLPVVRGTSIEGLLTGPSTGHGIPHVAGVRTTDGADVHADLVVDATGRRSKLPDWLDAIGARRPTEDAEESNFFYYTRYFRTTTGDLPPFRAGLLTHFHSFSLLTLPGDAGTWSVTVFFFAGDPLLKALRDPARWTALVAACPTHAQWLDGEPISDVLPMGGITDRYRQFVVDGAPVATGMVAVGDAAVCTNPVGGRGLTMGLMQAVGTAEVVGQHLDDPLALALAHDAMLQTRLTPWYRSTVAYDRVRMAQIQAAVQGRPAPHPSGPAEGLEVAMLYDPTLFRAYLEIVSLLALPGEVLARPGIVGRIMELADVHEPTTPACPGRDDLLRLAA